MHRYLRRLFIIMILPAALSLAGCRSDPPDVRAEKELAAQAQIKTTADGRQMLTMPTPPGGAPTAADTFVNTSK